MSHIIELSIVDFKRISAVTVKPDGSIVTLSGRNAQGKSSVLDAIQAALGGKRAAPAQPIRDGAERAEVVLTTANFVVKRSWTANGSYLKVESIDGARYASPSTFLASLADPLAFDPVAFAQQTAKEQAETIKTLLGLDLSDIEAAHGRSYEIRRDANREVKRIQAAIESMPAIPPNTPSDPVRVTDLLEQLDTAQKTNRQIDELRRHQTITIEEITTLAQQIVTIRAQLAELETARDQAVAKLSALSLSLATSQPVDTDTITQQIADAQEINDHVTRLQRKQELQRELNAQAAVAYEAGNDIAELKIARVARIEEATQGIPGLDLYDSGVSVDGIPLEQRSQAEKITIAVRLLAATNPGLRIVLIREGSFLDAESRAALAQVAQNHDLQIWIEIVRDTPDGDAIWIEDGTIGGDDQ